MNNETHATNDEEIEFIILLLTPIKYSMHKKYQDKDIFNEKHFSLPFKFEGNSFSCSCLLRASIICTCLLRNVIKIYLSLKF